VPAAVATASGLIVGVLADAALGDPRRGHPVALFGSAAGRLERRLWSDSRGAGVGYTACCVGAAVATGVVVEAATRRPSTRAAAVALATWTVLGGTSLRREATAVHGFLAVGDLDGARARVSALVGRDPARLDESEIARAVVESVAENQSDAVVAPLFWGAIGGVPALLGYRAVNTLDAMVGHRSPRYANFGWASARLDDVANVVPARLTAVLVALVSGRLREVWRAVRSGARNHPSPNAGWCEAAFAGALEVRLGGTNVYGGRVEERPPLGDGKPAARADIPRATTLSRRVTALATVATAVLALATRRRR
jgi:adenosylcobinamide-phosphate synthase